MVKTPQNKQMKGICHFVSKRNAAHQLMGRRQVFPKEVR